jgi:hypothetical protein
MREMIGEISGYLIVLTFTAVALIIRKMRSRKKEVYSHHTISDMGIYPEIRRVITYGCIIIALLGLPFMYSLDLKIGLFSSQPTVLFGILASIALIFTGFTVGRPDSLAHNAFSYIFMISLFLYGLGINLLALNSFRVLAIAAIFMLAANAFITVPSLIRCLIYKQRPNGIIEITYLGLNSIWIMMYAIVLHP